MFGQRLRELRKEQNLSLRELADKLNMSYSALGKYERGERHPDFETLEKIASYFGVMIDYLLGRSDIKTLDEYVYFSDVRHLGEKIKEAEPEVRKIASNIVDKVYLMLYHKLDTENLDYLNVLYAILDQVWLISLSFKVKAYQGDPADLENLKNYTVDDYLASKNEINKLLDIFVKQYITTSEEMLQRQENHN